MSSYFLQGDNCSVTVESSIVLAQRIAAALPQTQCTRCGFPDCAAYAGAIATAQAPINQCPPGGAEGIARLAAITGRPALPLNPEHGLEAPRTVAFIDEAWCIGCTLCLAACPVDAIFGSNRLMHTVIEPHCTGCELCIPVCPVDCISLENVTGEQTGWAAWSQPQADAALVRYENRIALRPSLVRKQPETVNKSLAALKLKADSTNDSPAHGIDPIDGVITPDSALPVDQKKAVIAAALARARARADALRNQPG